MGEANVESGAVERKLKPRAAIVAALARHALVSLGASDVAFLGPDDFGVNRLVERVDELILAPQLVGGLGGELT